MARMVLSFLTGLVLSLSAPNSAQGSRTAYPSAPTPSYYRLTTLPSCERNFLDSIVELSLLVRRGERATIWLTDQGIFVNLPADERLTLPETLTIFSTGLDIIERIINAEANYQTHRGFYGFYRFAMLGFTLCVYQDLSGEKPNRIVPASYGMSQSDLEEAVRLWRSIMHFGNRSYYTFPVDW